ncbi:hypothetical protein L873DRAFT_1809412 [Choiromyces venosus 120613-1]|uniref:Uncharacterized protein n=1 Tax=Choiromyces venosus 120613-1 TaxID=1336337 RepID=A0A3N4JKX5_9PEZI|nr:hypothetical protein L873DRAFT_1809412 [Choiromyces venosus 120613-1]
MQLIPLYKIARDTTPGPVFSKVQHQPTSGLPALQNSQNSSQLLPTRSPPYPIPWKIPKRPGNKNTPQRNS